ncbi:MAG: histidine--tRNA ligase [Oscillospiraceae bacterium]|jgi:histidyl-tRNA synthetase|nr:histidine--tRNA ligase [Oscillospiraceae bacterium]
MPEKLTLMRGMHDVLPEETPAWRWLEGVLRGVAERFSYEEIRFPTLEYTELFQRGVGGSTDVVQKEMYTFTDRDGSSVTLRPEGTASVVRAFVEHALHAGPLPLKVYYIAPNFRHEKPQAGRLREHHQFGVECFGPSAPAADAEVVALAHTFLTALGLKDIVLHVNSIGCPACRPAYHTALRAYFEARADTLCPTCRERLSRNPLRILDCKNPDCRALAGNAPVITDHLCPDCRAHHQGLADHLAAMDIPFVPDPMLVRGLDYYTRTVFEFTTDCIGAQSTLCGGGRYDGLVSTLGGPPTPAMGFGSGLERLLLALEAQGVKPERPTPCQLYIAAMGEAAARLTTALTAALRGSGVKAERDLMGRSLKAQMKQANRLGAAYVLVLGADELAAGRGVLKRMDGGGADLPCELSLRGLLTALDLIVGQADGHDLKEELQ